MHEHSFVTRKSLVPRKFSRKFVVSLKTLLSPQPTSKTTEKENVNSNIEGRRITNAEPRRNTVTSRGGARPTVGAGSARPTVGGGGGGGAGGARPSNLNGVGARRDSNLKADGVDVNQTWNSQKVYVGDRAKIRETGRMGDVMFVGRIASFGSGLTC